MVPPLKTALKSVKLCLALADVIELIAASARATVAPEKLLAAVEQFLELFRDAWGSIG